MGKYTGISIGPILKTLTMARKPRELWAASYIFSYLMKCIYAEAEKRKADIISPAKPDQEQSEVGIFPDRIYVKGEFNAKETLSQAMQRFYSDLFGKGENPDLDYFNLMTTTCDVNSNSSAIEVLNQKLDIMELWKFASADTDSAKTIYNIISKENDNPLYKIATGKDKFSIEEIEKIARIQLYINKSIKEKSHHRYFCVVQADGDNMGKVISHKNLNDGDVLKISKALVGFGLSASTIIKNFGGVPIYAGGDDLLFISPVIGKDGTNIFNLIDILENTAFQGVHQLVADLGLKDDNSNDIQASLSFGISISYHKHPLYEALKAAGDQLFKVAKQTEKKKAVAWVLTKHSGGTFSACFSRKDEALNEKFADLLAASTDENTVSAVAHKIRQFENIVNIVLESDADEKRLDALFEKILESSDENKRYFDAVKDLMPILYKVIGKKDYAQTLYSLLRTAKFINGEDLRDENE